MSYIYRPLNYIPDSADERDFKFNKRLFKKKTKDKRSKILGRLPKEVDHTPNMTPVKDQNSLGSCVAFACTAVKEWQERQEYLRIKKEKGKKVKLRQNPFSDLSEQWLYWNCKKIDNIRGEGTNLRTAMKVLQKKGIPIEEAWEYNPNTKGSPEEWASRIARYTRINNYYRIKNLTQMRLALLHSPVPIGVLVFDTFYDTQGTGVVRGPGHTDTSKAKGGHAICIVGYDDEKKMFKFKNSWGCYDEETEVLTKNGFKYFKDLNNDDLIATLNENNELEYQNFINYFEYPYEGKMHHYKNTKVDLLVTPNHNMYIQSMKERQYKENNFRLIKSDNINWKQIVFKRDAEWNGNEQEFFRLPSILQELNHYRTDIQTDRYIKMDDWLEFFGYWIAEGSLSISNCKKGGKQYNISIAQKKEKNTYKIRECLSRLGFNFSHHGKTFSISDKQLYDYLAQFGKCNEKFIPKELKQLSKRQLRILFDALMLGDGSINKTHNGSKSFTYYTTSKKLRDDFQEICLKLGLCTSYSFCDKRGTERLKSDGSKFTYNHIWYNININNMQSFNSGQPILGKDHFSKIDYNGKVYCVEVPNHVLFIRRNGKTCWCGNSSWGDEGYGYISYNYFLNFCIMAWAFDDLYQVGDNLDKIKRIVRG